MELSQLLKKHGFENVEKKGILFAGFENRNIKTRIGKNTKIAYIGYAKKE